MCLVHVLMLILGVCNLVNPPFCRRDDGLSRSFWFLPNTLAGEEWWDLCAGPHLERTGQLNRRAIELEFVAGAYWRGDEKNQMLQRIYGTAWESEEQLKAYQVQKEEAKRRDHRRLGQDLNLFSIQVLAAGSCSL